MRMITTTSFPAASIPRSRTGNSRGAAPSRPGDDYKGKPQTWRRLSLIPRPTTTILFGENASDADHIMPNFWVTPLDAADVDGARHRLRADYLFVDGHAELRRFASTYLPAQRLDLWHPAKAQ